MHVDVCMTTVILSKNYHKVAYAAILSLQIDSLLCKPLLRSESPEPEGTTFHQRIHHPCNTILWQLNVPRGEIVDYCKKEIYLLYTYEGDSSHLNCRMLCQWSLLEHFVIPKVRIQVEFYKDFLALDYMARQK